MLDLIEEKRAPPPSWTSRSPSGQVEPPLRALHPRTSRPCHSLLRREELVPDVQYKLAAENRSEAGKGAARRLRASGRVPAVLYGHGAKPEHLSVDARQFGQALRTDAGVNVLIELEVGKTHHLALAKEIQRHPVRGNLIHVDFIQVRRGEKVHVEVPVRMVGGGPGVREGGIADQDLYQLNVEPR